MRQLQFRIIFANCQGEKCWYWVSLNGPVRDPSEWVTISGIGPSLATSASGFGSHFRTCLSQMVFST
jgi:hypothetical protein